MTFSESVLAGAPRAGVALVQVTLVALLGVLAWRAVRRGGPALRGAVLLATLVGLLVVPGLAVVAPTWLPLPECLCPVDDISATADTGDRAPTPTPPPLSDLVVSVVVQPSPTKPPLNPEDPTKQAGDTAEARTKAEAVVLDVRLPAEDAAPPARSATGGLTPRRSPPSWPLVSLLAIVWLCGAVAFLARSLRRLALLYRCAREARPVRDEEWTDCVNSLSERYGLPAVALRESPSVTSPLTLGLFRPMILLPLGRRHWSAAERALILGHELAHVRRRDYLAGLLAELVSCLCWFHPLVRWLSGRLRLEQEYAADAWVAAVTSDSKDYVRCLARLALEQSQGRASLAPALWRRRPEILRRIDMLRRNPKGPPPRLGKRAAWTVAGLAAVACLVVAGVGPLRSAADDSKKAETGSDDKARATTDPNGDPLPEGALARLGTTRLRHGADVTFVAFGPDGKTLITAGQDNTIRLWDLVKRTEIRRFTRPSPAAPKQPRKGPDEVRFTTAMVLMAGARGSGSFRVALSPDGKTLAAAGSNVIQLWEVETGKELRQIQGPPTGLAGLLFSPDGRTLAARSSNGALFLWATDTGKEVHQIKPARRGGGNELILTFGDGGGSDAPGMAFTPDGKALAAAATDYKQEQTLASVKFWDVGSGKEIRKIKAPDGTTVSAVAIAPLTLPSPPGGEGRVRGGKLLAYGAGGVVHLCEADTGKEVRQLKPGDGGILSLVFSPDGKTLAVRGRNQRVRLWETETGKELHRLSDAEPPPPQSGELTLLSNDFFAPETRALAISPDGKKVASAAGSTVRLWETATGKELPLLEGHWRAPSSIVLSPDGKTVVSWGFDRVVRRWDAATGKPLGAFPAPLRTTLAAFSTDGRIIALANADNTIRLHDTTSGKELHRLKGHQNGIAALAFAPGGKVLASRGSGDNTIRLHDVARGVELRRITIRRPQNNGGGGGTVLVIGGPARGSRGTGPGLAFSPDGKLVVTPVSGGNDRSNALVFFDTTTGKEIRKIASPQPIASFAFSPDGRSLAAENEDRTITLWEVASGKERGQLGKAVAVRPRGNDGRMELAVLLDGISSGSSGPGGPVGVTFSPDGRALAVRGPDLSVRIWDVTAGKEISQLKGHGGRIETVAFAPNGKALASGATDTTILLWDTAAPLKDLSKLKTAPLTAAEVEALWSDLAGEDATKARLGIHKLSAAPGQAVPFLSERLKPATRIAPEKINGWIADLESEKFSVRRDAAANLLKIGEQAVPALQKALASTPPLETRKRIEELVDRLTGGTLTTEQLRLVRAVEALERMGAAEARRLLRTLAEGAPGTLPTREAQAALGRMTNDQ